MGSRAPRASESTIGTGPSARVAATARRSSPRAWHEFEVLLRQTRIRLRPIDVRGMRIPVSVIVSKVAHGVPVADVLRGYPDLEPQDIQQALRRGRACGGLAPWPGARRGPLLRERAHRAPDE